MKVYKKKEHSLFPRPFGVQGKLYLALTVFIYFDLAAPDDPLGEQELWKTIPDQLKPVPVLDVGMPKPRGEALVTGSCFSPRGTRRTVSTVSFRVGGLGKELAVFGDRFWKRNGGVVSVISDPVSFSEMPVAWRNAFGGPDFPANPIGKGMVPVMGGDGQTLTPLPNIECRRSIIGAISDRPEPAGFGVLDMMNPVRQKKTGTYDDKWLKERWPYFPDDMDYEYFNCAPPDQYMGGFFKGGESIEVLNMHPDVQLIQSHVPELRIRCFVTKKEAPKSDIELFQEVATHVDTLWLFPSILRGVAIYRGTTEIWDEEYEDVLRILVATERLADAPLPLEHYLEEQKKAADLTVPVDMAPFQEAAKKVADAMKKVKKIPKEIDRSIKEATGMAPVMPRTPTETAAVGQKVIADNLALLDRLEAQARELRAKHGHLGHIDLSMFDRMRESLRKASGVIGDGATRVEGAKAKALQNAATELKALADKIKKTVPASVLAKGIPFDPEALLDRTKKVNPWHDRGFPLVVQWRRNLEADRDAQDALHRLGIERDTIKRAWIGINPAQMTEPRTAWGLAPSGENPKGDAAGDDLALPRGLVMPRFDGPALNRILILPEGWPDGSVAGCGLAEGSDETPLFLLAEDGAPVVAVADELQALLADQEIGDACSIVVLGRPDEKPSKEGGAQIKTAQILLVVMPEKAAAGTKEWDAWTKAWPNCLPRALPRGDNLFAARRLGVDIRAWIMEVMPGPFVKKHKIAPALPEQGGYPTVEGLKVPIPAIDVKALVEKSGKDIRAVLDRKRGEFAAKNEQAEAQLLSRAREAIKKAGLDPDEIMKANPDPAPVSISAAGDSMLAKLDLVAAAMKKRGVFSPEIEKKFDAMAAVVRKLSQEGQSGYDAGMARIEAAKKIAAASQAKAAALAMPPEAKAIFAKHGMDIDRMVPRTREEVIEMHGRGESLAFARLSGVDLSGLDLRGIDLNQAQCMKTSFAGSILDGADLAQVIATEADFTGASLKGATLDKSMLIKAKLGKANFRGAGMKQVTIKDADLTDADLTDADLFMVTIMGTSLKKARLNNIKAHLSILSDGDASEAQFKAARMDRCLLRRLALDKADFSHSILPSTTFMEVAGREVVFFGANMHKTRMGNGSQLAGADLRNVTFTLGSLRETDLSGSKLTGTRLDGALIEKCDLHGADLYGTCAKTCRFSKSNLEGADMRFVNLYCGSLRKSRLVNADLRGANLYAVDFYKAVFGETRMEDANVKQSLLFKRMDALRGEQGIA